jgi:hypothetical protein
MGPMSQTCLLNYYSTYPRHCGVWTLLSAQVQRSGVGRHWFLDVTRRRGLPRHAAPAAATAMLASPAAPPGSRCPVDRAVCRGRDPGTRSSMSPNCGAQASERELESILEGVHGDNTSATTGTVKVEQKFEECTDQSHGSRQLRTCDRFFPPGQIDLQENSRPCGA